MVRMPHFHNKTLFIYYFKDNWINSSYSDQLKILVDESKKGLYTAFFGVCESFYQKHKVISYNHFNKLDKTNKQKIIRNKRNNIDYCFDVVHIHRTMEYAENTEAVEFFIAQLQCFTSGTSPPAIYTPKFIGAVIGIIAILARNKGTPPLPLPLLFLSFSSLSIVLAFLFLLPLAPRFFFLFILFLL